MGKCVVKECLSRTEIHKKASGITFHTVPKDAVRRDKWVEIIRLLRKETDWLPTKSTIICSKHFRDEHRISPINACGRVRLSDEAVPMLVEESNLGEQAVDVNETDEEMNEVIETPRKHKMRKIINRLIITSTNRLKRLKNISQKYRRLKRNNKKLKDIIKELIKRRGRNAAQFGQ